MTAHGSPRRAPRPRIAPARELPRRTCCLTWCAGFAPGNAVTWPACCMTGRSRSSRPCPWSWPRHAARRGQRSAMSSASSRSKWMRPAVRDQRARQAAPLHLPDEGQDVGIEQRFAAEQADDGPRGRELVEKTDVVGERHLAAQPDQLTNPAPLLFTIGRGGGAERAENAGVAPLSAHLAAKVAKVRDAELHERRHREVAGAGRGKVLHHFAASPTHAAQVAARETRELQTALEAHFTSSGSRIPVARSKAPRPRSACCTLMRAVET